MKSRERYDGSPKSFRIRADNVPAAGIEITETLSAGFLTRLIEEPNGQISWKAVSDTLFSCRLAHEADMLLLTGGGIFKTIYPCIRCVEDVEFEVEVALNIRLLPIEKDPDQGINEFESESFEDVSSLSSSDSENESVTGYYEDGIIDLSEVLREQLFLEFPQYPSCESLGTLDPKECDLSAMENTNSQAATIIEHPFARLKDWKPQISN